jgi:hypothetical protein
MKGTLPLGAEKNQNRSVETPFASKAVSYSQYMGTKRFQIALSANMHGIETKGSKDLTCSISTM